MDSLGVGFVISRYRLVCRKIEVGTGGCDNIKVTFHALGNFNYEQVGQIKEICEKFGIVRDFSVLGGGRGAQFLLSRSPIYSTSVAVKIANSMMREIERIPEMYL